MILVRHIIKSNKKHKQLNKKFQVTIIIWVEDFFFFTLFSIYFSVFFSTGNFKKEVPFNSNL